MSRNRLSSVASAVAVLKSFTSAAPNWGVSDLAAHTGQSKSSVHRILSTLTDEGLLEQDPTSGRYRLGLGLPCFGRTHSRVQRGRPLGSRRLMGHLRQRGFHHRPDFGQPKPFAADQLLTAAFGHGVGTPTRAGEHEQGAAGTGPDQFGAQPLPGGVHVHPTPHPQLYEELLNRTIELTSTRLSSHGFANAFLFRVRDARLP